MNRTSGFNTHKGNTPLMMNRGTFGVLVLVVALIACSGCMQPDKTMAQVPVSTGMNSTLVPVFIPSPTLPGQTGTIPAPVTILATPVPAGPAPSPAIPAVNAESGVFMRYTGADYSLDYPAAWRSNSTILPLREYRHLQYACSVTFAYNLDQELRMYSSPDGSTLFYSVVVNTRRDIWPRTLQGRVVYEDIANAVLGNPENCANYPDNEAFTIAGISQVPLAGVSYPGVRADFARINATGFTDGTGTMEVVTGQNHSGVFTFYSTSMDADSQANLSEYMFDSLHLDSGF
jgi:hypothetical protein